ncbi:hypothetical protein FOZ60_005875 [Perkinsus olseni]|uniref:Uncharacterized protein n=1 Tax=Perkinsus olseni TaxID=32597 RepID=A0A7J6PG40_PEROL|nr:hypothetical protein FOZ60_005875 [Perkinsus olseni]
MAPTIRFRPGNRRFIGLQGILLLSVFMVHRTTCQVVNADEPSQVVMADYPKGCKRGPGPGKGSVLLTSAPGLPPLPPHTNEGTCIYIMKGVNEDGKEQETVGMSIRTNDESPGAVDNSCILPKGGSDTMVIELNIVGDDATVKADGGARLFFRSDVLTTWNLAPTMTTFANPSGPSDVKIMSKTFTNFPNGQVASSGFYDIEGAADQDKLDLEATVTPPTNSQDVKLEINQKLSFQRVPGGWSFDAHIEQKGDFPDGRIRRQLHRFDTLAGGVLFG